MKVCKQCKTECTNEAKFCQECGYRFTEDDKPVKVCKNCNTHNSELSKFCQECGLPLNTAPNEETGINPNADKVVANDVITADKTPQKALETVIENDYVVSSLNDENGSQTITADEEPTQSSQSAEVSTEDIIEPDEVSKPEEHQTETKDSFFENSVNAPEGVPCLDEMGEPDTKVEPEAEQVQQFDIKTIIENDPYYDDVPLGDNGATKEKLGKEKIREIALIIGGALFIIGLITAFLVITA